MPRSRAFLSWLDEVDDGRSRWADTERGLETRQRSEQMVVITRLIS